MWLHMHSKGMFILTDFSIWKIHCGIPGRNPREYPRISAAFFFYVRFDRICETLWTKPLRQICATLRQYKHCSCQASVVLLIKSSISPSVRHGSPPVLGIGTKQDLQPYNIADWFWQLILLLRWHKCVIKKLPILVFMLNIIFKNLWWFFYFIFLVTIYI